MSILSRNQYREEFDEISGESVWRINPYFAFFVMVPVIWMAASRGRFGDTGLYISIYKNMPSLLKDIPRYIETVNKDKGFAFFSAVIHCINGNVNFYFLIIAIIHSLSIVVFFRKYSLDYVFSIFLFIASTDYLSWMFNGIRQFTAVALILFAVPWILRKNYIIPFIIILIASTMHQSALLMIPVMFIAQGEAWNWKTLLFILATLVMIAFVGQFTSLLNDALAGTVYKNVVSDYTSWNDDGTNPLRVLLYSVPAIISFFYREQIRRQSNELINLCVNMSIVSMGLYLLSMFTSGIFFGRLPIYCSLYGYILLPWEMKAIEEERYGKTINVLLVMAYLVFYAYAIIVQWGL
ncbi:MAG: EpsG family protein [Clostridia bacterium]|nr:EpsG family protein [Clostridia bacterium]